MDRDEALRRVPMFAALPPDARAEISSLFASATYRSGDYIFLENDHATHLFVLLSGVVKLVKHSETGRDVILRIFTPGEVFGGIAFQLGQKYPVTAQTQTDAAVLILGERDFLNIVRRYPEVALTLIRVLASHLHDAHEQIRQLVTERVERRLARKLLELAGRVGIPEGKHTRLDMLLKRQDLAEMTGTTIETVSRIVSRWYRNGIMEGGPTEVIITNSHQLMLIAANLDEKMPELLRVSSLI